MAEKKLSLGRGLSSLLGEERDDAPAPATGGGEPGPRQVPIAFLRPGTYQPRKTMDPAQIDDLAASIADKGILQPILVRRLDAAGSTLTSQAAHPGYSATNLQGHTGNPLGTRFWETGNSLFATTADFGARQTLYAASADLPGNTFIGPRFAMRGPTGASPRSPLARDAGTARSLWELSTQLTGTEFPL